MASASSATASSLRTAQVNSLLSLLNLNTASFNHASSSSSVPGSTYNSRPGSAAGQNDAGGAGADPSIPSGPPVWKRIAQDMKRMLYENFYVNFTSTVPKPVMEEFANLVATDGTGQLVQQVYDQYLNFIVLEPNLFELLPDASPAPSAAAANGASASTSTVSTYERLNDPEIRSEGRRRCHRPHRRRPLLHTRHDGCTAHHPIATRQRSRAGGAQARVQDPRTHDELARRLQPLFRKREWRAGELELIASPAGGAGPQCGPGAHAGAQLDVPGAGAGRAGPAAQPRHGRVERRRCDEPKDVRPGLEGLFLVQELGHALPARGRGH
ncbi:hypothetical protein L1887_61009 [Cichorium endivia]|nr:hypothetical protein L1887_61009 [Cichorium endivia]